MAKHVAFTLSAEGARVVLNSLPSAAGSLAPDTVKSILADGAEALATFEDTSSLEGATRLIDQTLEAYGRLDILINFNSSHAERATTLFDLSENEWDSTVASDLKAAFACTRAASSAMRNQRFGRVITFSSTSALNGAAGYAVQGATKAALLGFTRDVAREIGPYGVTCNTIALPLHEGNSTTSNVEIQNRNIASLVAALSVEEAGPINSQVFLIAGGSVSLIFQPAPHHSIYHSSIWSLNELSQMTGLLDEAMQVSSDGVRSNSEPKDQWLKGRVAIVTGAGRGIGRGIAHFLAAEGANVLVNDYGVDVNGENPRSGPAQDVANEIRASGGAAVPNFESVATVQGGERIIQAALQEWGKLDILVNGAGMILDRLIWDMSEAEWDRVISINMKGHYCTVKPACQVMRRQGSGRIINFTSNSGLLNDGRGAHYCAAKAGNAGFTRCVARDVAPFGITCNAVAPTAHTRMTDEGSRARGTMSDAALQAIPGPEGVAPMVAWLCSDEAATVNGRIFQLAGGAVSLVHEETPFRTITKKEPWAPDELLWAIPRRLLYGIPNPAPLLPL